MLRAAVLASPSLAMRFSNPGVWLRPGVRHAGSAAGGGARDTPHGLWRDPTCTLPSPAAAPQPASRAASTVPASNPAVASSSTLQDLEPGSPLRVLLFGSDGLAAVTLSKLLHSFNGGGSHAGLVSKLELVCPADKTYNRKLTAVPTKTLAVEHGLPVHTLPPDCRNLKRWLPPYDLDGPDCGFDIAVVVSFGYFLPGHALRPLPFGAINMHPSLLPKYRGPCPIQHTLLNGDTMTGVSIVDVDPYEFDAGAILRQVEEPVRPEDCFETLRDRLAVIGADAVMKVLQDLRSAREGATRQDRSLMCEAPFLPRKNNVRWDNMTRVRLYNAIRARGQAGGVYTHLRTPSGLVRVNILGLGAPDPAVRGGPPLDVSPLEAVAGDGAGDAPAPPSASVLARKFEAGTLYFDKPSGALWVKCCDQWAEVTAVATAGKKVRSVKDFVNGYRIKPGSTDHSFVHVREDAEGA